MVATEQAFIKLKYFGQPYIPTDYKELLFVADIHSRRLYHHIRHVFLEHYFHSNTEWSWTGAVALVRDLLVLYWVLSFVGQLYVVIRGYGILGVVSQCITKIKKTFFAVVMQLPPIRNKVNEEFAKTKVKVEQELMKNDDSLLQFPELPPIGLSPDVVLSEFDLLDLALAHSDWSNGRVTGAVYHGGDELLLLQLKAYEKFSVANQLHPDAFPAVRKMEAEVVAMVLRLFNGPDLGCGTTTSGGTESLLLAGLAAREYGRRTKGIHRPEVIAPVTVHAGIDKACYYFNMKLHKVDVDPKTYQVDVGKVKKLINANTVLLVGSAPNYPHGIIDDIESLSKLAVKYKIPLHVDACLGSFIVTFLAKSGVHGDRKLPLFDFRVPGVTSISCDTHKYGFAPKGSSIIMYRNPDIRQCQYYVLSDWTGGMYGSPTLAGSRPGALMAGCWASLINIGENGYRDLCYDIVSATMKLKTAIQENKVLNQHLEVLGDPIASVVAFTTKPSSKINIYLVGDAVGKRGWHFATLQNPQALHFALTRLTVPVIDLLIEGLVEAVEEVVASGDEGPKSDTAALYGVAGNVSTAGVADRLIVTFLDTLYKL